MRVFYDNTILLKLYKLKAMEKSSSPGFRN